MTQTANGSIRLFLSPTDAEVMRSLCVMYISDNTDKDGNPLSPEIAHIIQRVERLGKRMTKLLNGSKHA